MQIFAQLYLVTQLSCGRQLDFISDSRLLGGNFLDLDDIHLNPDERPEDLFQCLMAFVEVSLIKPHTLLHHGSVLEEEEELSLTLENFVILTEID